MLTSLALAFLPPSLQTKPDILEVTSIDVGENLGRGAARAHFARQCRTCAAVPDVGPRRPSDSVIPYLP